MEKKFLKKIIAQSEKDLRIISALCSESEVVKSNIKFLKKNKVFLIPVLRKNKEKENSEEKISSIIKFEYVEHSKSKNIKHNDNSDNLHLIAIDLFRKNQNYEIVLLFLNNKVITLKTEIIEVTLEDIKT